MESWVTEVKTKQRPHDLHVTHSKQNRENPFPRLSFEVTKHTFPSHFLPHADSVFQVPLILFYHFAYRQMLEESAFVYLESISRSEFKIYNLVTNCVT